MTTVDLYRRLTFQPTAVIFGWRLLPYTVGHAILFDRLEVESVSTATEVCLAARLCSMHADEAERWLTGRWANARLGWMLRTRRAWLLDAKEVEKAAEVFHTYLEEQTRLPAFVAKTQSDGVESGVPFAQRLRVVLLSRLNYRPEDVNRTPYLRALWDYIGWAEVEGHIRVPPDVDDATEAALVARGEELARKLEKGEIRC